MHVRALDASGKATPKVWQGPVRPGQWDRFVMRVKWSPDPSVGFIELWRNGQVVIPRSSRPTMQRLGDGTADPNYFKQGLYRRSEVARSQVVYHDATKVGLRYEDVSGTAGAR